MAEVDIKFDKTTNRMRGMFLSLVCVCVCVCVPMSCCCTLTCLCLSFPLAIGFAFVEFSDEDAVEHVCREHFHIIKEKRVILYHRAGFSPKSSRATWAQRMR